MLQKKDVNTNIKSYALSKHGLFYLENTGSIIAPSGDVICKIEEKWLGEIFVLSNYLVWQNGHGDSLIYDIDKEKEIFSSYESGIPITFIPQDLTRKEYLHGAIDSNEGTINVLFDIQTFQYRSFDWFIHATMDSANIIIALTDYNQTINRVGLDGGVIWSYTIDSKFRDIRGVLESERISRILGLYNGIIWVGVSSGRILAIEADTGKCVDVIKHNETANTVVDFDLNTRDGVPGIHYLQLDKKKDKLFGVVFDFYNEIDLNQPEAGRSYISLKDEFAKYEVRSNYTAEIPFDTSHIYFVDQKESKICALNRSTLKIDSCLNLNLEKQGLRVIMDIKKLEDKLYVKDRYEQLHILKIVK